MKKLLIVSTLVLLVASIASASTLVNALPMGRGAWAFSLSGTQISNFQGMGNDVKANTYGLSIDYGLLDSLDLYVTFGTSKSDKFFNMVDPSSFAGLLPGTLPSINVPLDNTISNGGAVLKYTLLNEFKGSPISLAIAGGGATFTAKTTGTINLSAPLPVAALPLETNQGGFQGGAGLIVSKVIMTKIPFIPYAAVTYQRASGGGNTVITLPAALGGGKVTQISNPVYTQLELSFGSYIALSKQMFITLEYTSQNRTNEVGPNFNQGQVGVQLSYSL